MTFDPSNVGSSDLIQRARRVLMEPQAEFERIAAEPADVNKLYAGYVLPLAALAAVCTFIGHFLFLRFGLISSLVEAVSVVVFGMVGVFIAAFVANALAPSFGSEQNMGQAHKLAAYSFTAALLAGVFMLVPMLGWLAILGLYSIGLLYIGLPRLMKTPEDKRVAYTAVIFIVCIVAVVVLNLVLSPLTSLVPGNGPPGYRFGQVQTDVSETSFASGDHLNLGVIEREVAQHSGPPVNPQRLQDQLPQTLPGGFALATQSSSSAEGASSAEGVYESNGARMTVRIVHIAAVEAVAAVATSMDVEETGRDAGGYARMQSIGGRLYSEEVNNDGSASYGVVGRGVAVMAEGTGGVTLDQMRAAVEIIGVQRLEHEFGA